MSCYVTFGSVIKTLLSSLYVCVFCLSQFSFIIIDLVYNVPLDCHSKYNRFGFCRALKVVLYVQIIKNCPIYVNKYTVLFSLVHNNTRILVPFCVFPSFAIHYLPRYGQYSQIH